jgi:hypothetical protein
MLTIMFLTLVYSTLRNRDLKIIQATAQRWMINGHGGINYKIVFTPKKHKEKLNVDTVWIHNKPYKPALSELSQTAKTGDVYSEDVLAIDLTEAQPTASENISSLPSDIPSKKGDAIIVYTIGDKKRYHIIHQLQQLPCLIAN